MVRVGVLVGAFIAGAVAAAMALYVALYTASGVIMADDMVDALVIVSDRSLSRFPRGSVVYVKSSVSPLLLEKLQPKYPALTLKSYSERPEDDDCKADRGGPVAPCARADFVKLEVLSAPTLGTMLVAVGTSNTFGQALLLKLLGRWRVIVERSYAI
jgi:hypothetical protein